MTKRFKREEPLRYEFAKPIDTTFVISQLRGEPYQSKPAKGVLVNISPGGLRLLTELDLPKGPDVMLTFTIHLAGYDIVPEGEVVWKEKRGNNLMYGVNFNYNPEIEKTIYQALKAYAVQARNSENIAPKRRRSFE